MKRMMCIVLMLAMLLCGCAGSGGNAEQTAGTEAATEASVSVTEIQDPEITLPKGELEQEDGEKLQLGETGAERVAYTRNVSSVHYVTSVEELPDYEALADYDEAYFRDHALLVVLESVGIGSVQVAIDSVSGGAVTLSHTQSGDAGTTVMTTWLLWAEVEKGLDYSWYIANPALKSQLSLS